MEDERLVELDRDYRRQVRRAYYLREEDFEPDCGPDQTIIRSALDKYNDYLEEVEELIEQLINEETRNDARKRLDKCASVVREKTAKNRAKLDHDRKDMADLIQREKEEKLEIEERRRRDEKARQDEQIRARNILEAEVAAGRSNVTDAQRKLRKQMQEFTTEVTKKEYVPVLPQQRGPVLVQPIDPTKMKEEKDNAMQPSMYAQREKYEDDPDKMRLVCTAGGCDNELWRQRYSQEAFCSNGLDFCTLTLHEPLQR